MPAVGALASVTTSARLLAVALVISPQRAARAPWRPSMVARRRTRAASPALQSDAARALGANAMADALPLFEALARGEADRCTLPLSATLSLQLQLRPALQLDGQR